MEGRKCYGVFDVQVDAARYRLYESATNMKSKAQQYGNEAKEYVKSKTDTSTAALINRSEVVTAAGDHNKGWLFICLVIW